MQYDLVVDCHQYKIMNFPMIESSPQLHCSSLQLEQNPKTSLISKSLGCIDLLFFQGWLAM